MNTYLNTLQHNYTGTIQIACMYASTLQCARGLFIYEVTSKQIM